MGETFQTLSLVNIITSYTVCSIIIVSYSFLFYKAYTKANLTVIYVLCVGFIGSFVAYAYMQQIVYTCTHQDEPSTCDETDVADYNKSPEKKINIS